MKMIQSFSLLLVVTAASLVISLFSPGVWAEDKPGFRNESEAGVNVISGNAKTQSYSVRQENIYTWDTDALRFNGRFLRTDVDGSRKAKNYMSALRYERVLSPRFNVFAAQALESDIFAGYVQRYNSDVGGKYLIIKKEGAPAGIALNAELGYRYSLENRLVPPNVRYQLGRVYAEALKDWNPDVSTKLWFEYLPNFTNEGAYQFNTEASMSAVLTSVFSVKVSELIKYNAKPAVGALNTDSFFTTALVAKF